MTDIVTSGGAWIVELVEVSLEAVGGGLAAVSLNVGDVGARVGHRHHSVVRVVVVVVGAVQVVGQLVELRALVRMLSRGFWDLVKLAVLAVVGRLRTTGDVSDDGFWSFGALADILVMVDGGGVRVRVVIVEVVAGSGERSGSGGGGFRDWAGQGRHVSISAVVKSFLAFCSVTRAAPDA